MNLTNQDLSTQLTLEKPIDPTLLYKVTKDMSTQFTLQSAYRSHVRSIGTL